MSKLTCLEWLMEVIRCQELWLGAPHCLVWYHSLCLHSDSALRQSLRFNVPVNDMCGAFFQINATFLWM